MQTAAVNVDFTGVEMPFSVGDMITTAFSFLGIFDTWALLGLGVAFTGIIVGFIFYIIAKGKKAAPGGGK
jgi:hypothetical protein